MPLPGRKGFPAISQAQNERIQTKLELDIKKLRQRGNPQKLGANRVRVAPGGEIAPFCPLICDQPVRTSIPSNQKDRRFRR